MNHVDLVSCALRPYPLLVSADFGGNVAVWLPGIVLRDGNREVKSSFRFMVCWEVICRLSLTFVHQWMKLISEYVSWCLCRPECIKDFPCKYCWIGIHCPTKFFTSHLDNRGGVGGANTHRKGSQARDRNLFALYSLQVNYRFYPLLISSWRWVCESYSYTFELVWNLGACIDGKCCQNAVRHVNKVLHLGKSLWRRKIVSSHTFQVFGFG